MSVEANSALAGLLAGFWGKEGEGKKRGGEERGRGKREKGLGKGQEMEEGRGRGNFVQL